MRWLSHRLTAARTAARGWNGRSMTAADRWGIGLACLLVTLTGLVSSPSVQGQQPASGNPAPPVVNVVNDRRQVNRPLFITDTDIPTGNVRRIVFEPRRIESRFSVYSAGDDKVVRRWLVTQTDGKYEIHPQDKLRWPIQKNDPSGQIAALAYHDYGADQQLLAFGGVGIPRPAVRVVSRTAMDEPLTLVDPELFNAQVCAVDWHPDVPLLAVCLNDATDSRLTFWRVSDRPDLVRSVPLKLKLAHRLRFSPDGRWLIVADRHQQVQVFAVNAQSTAIVGEPGQIALSSPIQDVGWSSDENWAVATFGQGVVHGSAKTGKVLGDPAMSIVHSEVPNEVQIGFNAVGQAQTKKKVFFRQTVPIGREVRELRYTNPVKQAGGHSGLFVPRGSLMELRLVAGQNHAINLSRCSAMASSRTGDVMAWATYDIEQERLFGLKPSQIAVRLRGDQPGPLMEDSGFSGVITALAFSEDGRYLMAAGNEAAGGQGLANIELRLWDVSSGRLLARYPTADQSRTSPGSSPIARVELGRTQAGESVVLFERGAYTPTMAASSTANLERASHPTAALQLTAPRGFVAAPKNFGLKPRFWRFGEVANRERTDVVYWGLKGSASRLESVIGPFETARASNPKLHPMLHELGPENCAVSFINSKGKRFLAVGYDRGILIWDVEGVRTGGAINGPQFGRAICRGLVGHEGRTTSVAVDNPQQARVLLSGSDDGTICGWSLDGLTLDVSKRNELGVKTELTDNGQRLMVTQVDSAAPGFLAGFEAGQEVVGLESSRLPATTAAGSPAQWKQLLEDRLPGDRIIVRVKASSDANSVVVQSQCLHLPLWTLYPWNDVSNWTIWTPEGYFVASRGSAQTIGWQLNMPLRFTSAETHWDRFHRDVLFDDLLENHNRRRYLAKVHGMVTPINVFASRVRVSLESPATSDRLQVNVRVDRTGDERVVRLQLWCNSRLVEEITDAARLESIVGTAPWQLEISDADLREGPNLLTAVVDSDLNGELLRNEDQLAGVRRPPSDPATGQRARPKLHFLGVGVTHLDHAEQWGQSANSIKPLRYAANDIARMALAWKGLTGDRQTFDAGQFQLVFDVDSLQPAISDWPEETRAPLNSLLSASNGVQSPTRSGILQALERFCEHHAPASDDLLVVHLAGHGFDENAIGAPEDVDDEFYFVARDSRTDFQNCVTRTELETAFRRLPCRTLLMVDTCFAGKMLKQDLTRPSNLLGPQILASCAAGELSHENGQAGGSCGNGVFTAAVVEALAGQQLIRTGSGQYSFQSLDVNNLEPENSDRQLSVEELGNYVRRRVPELLKLLAIEREQAPQIQQSLSFFTELTFLKKLD